MLLTPLPHPRAAGVAPFLEMTQCTPMLAVSPGQPHCLGVVGPGGSGQIRHKFLFLFHHQGRNRESSLGNAQLRYSVTGQLYPQNQLFINKSEAKHWPTAAGEANRLLPLSAAGKLGIFSRRWVPRSGCTRVQGAAASSACLAWLGQRP